MAYDEAMAERVRGVFAEIPLQTNEEPGELRMFGGLCFTVNRKMTVGVGAGRIMVRLSDADLRAALASGEVEPMDFTGKPLRNFAYLVPDASLSDVQLREWIERSLGYVRECMDKPTAKRRKRG